MGGGGRGGRDLERGSDGGGEEGDIWGEGVMGGGERRERGGRGFDVFEIFARNY